jgi:cell wall-associated NlpC family hydrolase
VTGIADISMRVGQLRSILAGQPADPSSAATGGQDFATALAAATDTLGSADPSGASNSSDLLASSGVLGGTDAGSGLSALLGRLGIGATGSVPGAGSGAGAGGAAVVTDARRYLGVPYVWGGTDPSTGLDCSGLVQRVYRDLGYSLPRVAADQARVGTAVPGLAQAQPGDILAFGSPAHHVGIYVGNGMMIDAPHTGVPVREEKVWETPATIRRILPSSAGSSTSDGSAALLGSGAMTGRAGSAALAGSGTAQAVTARYGSLFSAAATRYGVPAALLAGVATVESGGNPAAVSGAGAQGLMQLMPQTAAGLGVDPFDPAQAVDGAARLLARDLRTFGSTPLALAAYNAGPGAVRRYGGIPPYAETQSYVGKVQAAMNASGALG